jgi:hypothetical protein
MESKTSKQLRQKRASQAVLRNMLKSFEKDLAQLAVDARARNAEERRNATVTIPQAKEPDYLYPARDFPKSAGQSKKHSMIEVCLSIFVGFLISMVLQEWVVTPIWHLPTSADIWPTSGRGNLEITLLFTVVSIVRSYVFRRVFNWVEGK